ncbi:protein MpRLK-Pelle_WAK_LRK10L-8 [Marchantia polymorpha subsp. ruderalis]
MQCELIRSSRAHVTLLSWTSFLAWAALILGGFTFEQIVAGRVQEFESGASQQQQTCSDACGRVRVPYPFGTEAGCGLPQFRLQCEENGDSSSLKLSTGGSEARDLEIIDILPDFLIVNATNLRAACCNCTTTSSLRFDDSVPYAVSGDNLFFVNGCNSHGYFTSDKSEGYIMKCETGCANPDQIRENYCNSFGCCSSPVPSGSRALSFSGGGGPAKNNSDSPDGTCGYSSIIYPETYTTERADVLGSGRYGLKLSWAIQGPASCEEALQLSDYACSAQATCNFVKSVPGYTCSCDKKGYHGDGYKHGTGCSDTNECEASQLDDCHPDATCINYEGGHECNCKPLFAGDGLINGTGCKRVVQNFGPLTFGSTLTESNLEEDVDCGENATPCARRTFKKKRQSTLAAFLAGTGGYGTVFKGTLPNGTVVAIKKTNHVSDAGSEQFLNEVTILSQVNHRNLVKLLGCCLETEVPMLVYEYIPNGTLYEHLQGLRGEKATPLDWSQRLQIAIETAEALTYLHSHAFPPIYHRDVKSTNILLDNSLTVKVTDFGLSRLVPKDATHVSTVVMGTPGYMDPEYYQNYQLTDKSDVYSFGVVLLELITSLKPVDFERKPQQINLAVLSIQAIKRGELADIVDPILLIPSDPKVMESIEAVALLALDCLAPQREQRPTMKEVMEHLGKIKDAFNPEKPDRSPLNSERLSVDVDLKRILEDISSAECSMVLGDLEAR